MVTEIESSLLHDYYESSGLTSDMSSHWRDLSDAFQARIDEQGTLALHGEGFGRCKYVSVSHRILDDLTVIAHILHLKRRGRLIFLRREAVRLAKASGLDATFDVFRQVCTLTAIEEVLGHADTGRRFLVIGDGFGLLAALIKRIYPASKITLVDLGRTLLFQAHHISLAFPRALHKLAGSARSADADFVYCPSDRLQLLTGMHFDVAVNVASMQEMAAETVERYFAFMRRYLRPDNLFYCCNRERKVLIGGEISEFARYPWRAGDRIWFDGPCPWHRYYLGRGRTLNGPKVMGVRLPFIHYYDGVHRHRLATLETD